MHDKLLASFAHHFGSSPALIARAPGRVNLIGEHTDYNDGFVLPMALDRAVWIALRPRQDPRVVVYSLNFDQWADFSLNRLAHGGPGWSEYIKGVAWALQQAGQGTQGWEGVLWGDVPIGAGLSSSAALEMAAARALAAASGLAWEPVAMARIGQRAENEWVGVNCGIMDQMIAGAGRAGHALLIDCRTLEMRAIPLPVDTAVAVLDTATRRGLAGSAYNERRAQCEVAARSLGVGALRDVSPELFEARAHRLAEVIRRRARHVITENARALEAAEAMSRGDPAAMGRLMAASHASLRDDYEVSSRELDLMVDCAGRETGCYGARMTGAGFGGCAIALVRSEVADGFAVRVADSYRTASGLTPRVYVCAAADGAGLTILEGQPQSLVTSAAG